MVEVVTDHRMEWCPAGWSVCMPLIFPCTIKSRSAFLAPAHPGGPGNRAVKRLWRGAVWSLCLAKLLPISATAELLFLDSCLKTLRCATLDLSRVCNRIWWVIWGAGMGTRRQWPRPRRLASPAETRPRRDVQISKRVRDETFAGLETWL